MAKRSRSTGCSPTGCDSPATRSAHHIRRSTVGAPSCTSGLDNYRGAILPIHGRSVCTRPAWSAALVGPLRPRGRAPETIELAGWTYRRTGDRVPVTDYDPITDVLDTREGWAYEWDGLDPSGNRIDRETSLVLP